GQIGAISPLLGSKRERDPQLGRDGITEFRRHNSDHRVAPFAEFDCFSQDSRITREALPPQTIAEKDDLIEPRLLFARYEAAAYGGRDTEHVKETRRDSATENRFNIAFGGQVETLVAICRDLLKNASAGEKVGGVRRGDVPRVIALINAATFPYTDETIEIFE